ncbi:MULTISPECIES: hypothetical protein [Bartonella]|uniref:Secreted protein n=1 Tax=Bartonella chomelii TaxID=236402 RepID=A0ABR6E3C1_9HYPH|nr:MULTISPECIES: hypothetical protein [Bartonella]MBA9082758.1 hypothetical protein [Bartonella chomelii]
MVFQVKAFQACLWWIVVCRMDVWGVEAYIGKNHGHGVRMCGGWRIRDAIVEWGQCIGRYGDCGPGPVVVDVLIRVHRS